jgi:hypothetical protein
MSVNETTKRFLLRGFAAGLILIGALPACGTRAQEPEDIKGAFVEGVRNEHPAFLVRVSVDHKDCVYRERDTMTVTVQSEKGGYLYLFYFMADGKVSCLFPNVFQQDNQIAARQTTVVPKPGADFRIRIGPPFGVEYLKAVVSLQPLSALDIDTLTKAPMTEVSVKGIRGAYVEQLKPQPGTWAARPPSARC